MTFQMTRYRVEDADGTFLDEFATNAPDFAKERIDRIRKYRPDLAVTETDDTN
ncbi:hypothetical protein [Streptomyces parvus]|uniref:hypothetical protein n=1 Tax=Streptomyces parvus TaxID=66428 RepID=UPI00210106DC|nr:hypothetical protein [Streptomyces parvus]MCQ1582599.1 hypothetical protein [Streptomyces parvus]